MIDIIAAISLAEAASKIDGGVGNLYADAKALYVAYEQIASKKVTLLQLVQTPNSKNLLQSLARVTAVAAKLDEDAEQSKNIVALLQSLPKPE